MIELIKIEVSEITDTHTMFLIIVKHTNFFGQSQYKRHECFKENEFSLIHFICDGSRLWLKYDHLQESILAILSTKNQYYLKN